MISALRAFSKSWVAAALMGLLILSFAVFGINDAFRSSPANELVSAGSRKLAPEEYVRIFDSYLKSLEQQAGRPVTRDEAVKENLHIRILNEIASEKSFASLLEKTGIRPSDKLVADQISQQPQFFNAITGKFDKLRYEQELAQNKLRPKEFEAYLHDELASSQFGDGIVAGMRAPRIYSAMQVAFGMETRDASVFVLTPAAIAQPAMPTGAQLSAFYKENEARLRRPEFRAIQLVRFTAQDMINSVSVSDQEALEEFNFRKDSLVVPERRTFVQIPVKSEQDAQKVRTALAGGQNAEDASKLIGAKPIVSQNSVKSTVPDRVVADAAFALPSGGVSGLVKGKLGSFVIQILAVTPGQTPDFDSSKAEIMARLREEKAKTKAYEASDAFAKAVEGGDSLVQAAQKQKLTIIPLPPVTKEGAAVNGQPLGLPQQVLTTAWALAEGDTSGVEDLGNGEYYAIRIEKIVPSALPKLEDVRPVLTQAYMQREAGLAISRKADELSVRLGKGESLAAVAAAAKSQVQPLRGVARGSQQGLPEPMLAQIFGTKPKASFAVQINEFAWAIGVVDKVTPVSITDGARPTEDRRPEVTMQMFRDMADSARNNAKLTIKPKINEAAARMALGLPAEEKPADKKAEAKK